MKRLGILVIALAAINQSESRADYASSVLADSPIAYWRFEDGSVGSIFGLSGETATDSSGNGHTGVYIAAGLADGPAMVAAPTGLGSTAVHLKRGDTTQDGEFLLFDTLGSFGSNIDDNGATFEFFIRNLQDAADNRLFGVWNERPTPTERKTQFSFSLHRPVDTQELFLRDDSGITQEFEFDDSVVDINDGQWHHVAWVIEPGVPADGMKVYLDGVEVPLNEVSNNALSTMQFADLDKEFVIGGEHQAGFNITNFTLDAMIDEFAVYSDALTAQEIANHVNQAKSTILKWNVDGSGLWGANTSWAPVDGALGGVPNSSELTAVFGPTGGTPATAVLVADTTIGHIEFDNGGSYAVAGPATLTLAPSSSSDGIQVTQGTHQLQAPVQLATDATLTVASGARLDVNNELYLDGNMLTISGAGVVSISNTVSSGGGSLALESAILAGSGTIVGDVQNDTGTVAPGNSPGMLTVLGNYTQGEDASMHMELAGLVAGAEYDVLSVIGGISLAGELELSLLAGFVPAPGEQFKLLEANSIRGSFSTISYPALPSGMAWDAGSLYSAGIVSVVQIPEPSTFVLTALGVLMLIFQPRQLAARQAVLIPVSRVALAALLTVWFVDNVAHAQYSTAVLADNPLAYWRFDDGTQGSVLNGSAAADSSGNGHSGTYSSLGTDGPELVAGAPGVSGNGVRFVRGDSSAQGDFILFDTLGSLGSNIDDNGMTIEFFLKNQQDSNTSNRLFGVWNSRPEGTANTQLSFGFQDLQTNYGGPGDSFFLREEGGAAWAEMVDDTEADLKDGNWHHVAWVVDPGVPEGGVNLYIDGELTSTVPATGVFAPKALSNFADFDKELLLGGDHIFNGTMRDFAIDAIVDEFAIYNSALTQTQIQNHLAQLPAVDATSFAWNKNGFGDWSNPANWVALNGLGGSAPGGIDHSVMLGDSTTGLTVVVSDAAVTLNSMTIDSANQYVIAGTGDTTFDASSGPAAIDVLQGAHAFQGSVTLDANTLVDVADGASLTFDNQLSIGGQTLTKEGDGLLLINNAQTGVAGNLVVAAGTLGGDGSVGGNVQTQNGATTSPGQSAGELTIEGSYTQASGSTLEIELGGTSAGQFDPGLGVVVDREYDQLSVTGAVTISGGTLAVSLIDGFSLTAGDSFDILDFASLTGSFSTFDLPGGMASWNLSNLSTTGEITFTGSASLPGDYNGDGSVNLADYVVWRNSLGAAVANGTGADGNGNGTIDAGDYTFWKDRFGTSAAANLADGTAAIPEPATVMFALVGIAALVNATRRRLVHG